MSTIALHFAEDCPEADSQPAAGLLRTLREMIFQEGPVPNMSGPDGSLKHALVALGRLKGRGEVDDADVVAALRFATHDPAEFRRRNPPRPQSGGARHSGPGLGAESLGDETSHTPAEPFGGASPRQPADEPRAR